MISTSTLPHITRDPGVRVDSNVDPDETRTLIQTFAGRKESVKYTMLPLY